MTPRYLVDKSALERMPLEPVRRRLGPLIEDGEAATCSIIDLEVLFSARSARDHHEIRERRRLAYHQVPLSQEVFDRAIDVQSKLAETGQHRLPIPDLIIAAAAETHGLVVLHYDADFDRIAAVTRQPVEWVAEWGSV